MVLALDEVSPQCKFTIMQNPPCPDPNVRQGETPVRTNILNIPSLEIPVSQCAESSLTRS